jgi:hypothetical protein
MKALLWSLGPWVAALWWASLCTVGFWVVPLLFAKLPTAYMAGQMAAVLFAAQTWVALVCGLFLLMLERVDGRSSRGQSLLFISLGMLLSLLSEYVVAPHIVARENLRFWHSLGTLLYGAQMISAGWVLRGFLKRSGAAR